MSAEEESAEGEGEGEGQSEKPKGGKGGPTRARTGAREAKPALPKVESPDSALGREWGLFRDRAEFQRLEDVFTAMGMDASTVKFVTQFFRNTPAVQNPYGLYSLCRQMKTITDDRAWMVVQYVYGGPGQNPNMGGTFPGGFAPGFAPPQPGVAWGPPQPAVPVERPAREDFQQEYARRAMEEMFNMIRIRTMLQSFAPIMGNEASSLQMIPRLDESGKPVFDANGAPVFTYVQAAPRIPEQLVEKYERGDRLEMTEVMKAMQTMFSSGVDVALRAANSQGHGSDQAVVLQQEISKLRDDNFKMLIDQVEKRASAEREALQKQMELQSPEKQMETMKKWKDMGALGSDNMEARKIDIRFAMWQAEREDSFRAQQNQADREAAQAARSEQSMRNVMQLAQNAVDKVLSKPMDAIADGMRARFAGQTGPAQRPPGQEPRNADGSLAYDKMTPDMRKEFEARHAQLEQVLVREKSRLAAAAQQPPPAQ